MCAAVGGLGRGALTLRGRPLSRQTDQIHRKRVRRDRGPQKAATSAFWKHKTGRAVTQETKVSRIVKDDDTAAQKASGQQSLRGRAESGDAGGGGPPDSQTPGQHRWPGCPPSAVALPTCSHVAL